ncbi:MAG: hypothetical protein LBL99_01810 [Holosporaceae bacterium]|jgi:hypothetical protein|nr:hypothetical protein [Holosporaceae bacterium]
MKKRVTGKIMAIGILAFAAAVFDASAILKIGQSSALQSDLGAAYGIGVKGTLERAAKSIDELIKVFANLIKQIETTNSKYELATAEELREIKAAQKDLTSLKKLVELARDSKRKELEATKLTLTSLPQLLASLEKVVRRAKVEELDEGKFRDKAIVAAHKKKEAAQKALEAAETSLRNASAGVRASVQQFNDTIKGITFNGVEIPKLKVDQAEVAQSKAILKIEETFGQIRVLEEQIGRLQAVMSNDRLQETEDAFDAGQLPDAGAQEPPATSTHRRRHHSRRSQSTNDIARPVGDADHLGSDTDSYSTAAPTRRSLSRTNSIRSVESIMPSSDEEPEEDGY